MNRCVITPTYKNHFPFIERYLESFEKYLQDKDFPIFFVVNRDEKAEFDSVVEPYQKSLNLSILVFEDVLAHQGIIESPQQILDDLGRLSFQTIKKFFSALYIGAEQFLVLDSESIMISNTNLNELFDRYFSMPEFFLSQVNDRPKKFKDGFTYAFVTLASELTHYPPIYWPLESYNWFLDLKILKKMIEQYGNLYDRICELKLPKKFHDEGIEGELLYYPYIIHTPGQFGYQAYNTLDELKKYIGWVETWKFKIRFSKSWRAHGGYLEGLACFVTQKNVNGLVRMLQNHCMPILRISRVINKDLSCLDLKSQMELVERSGVKILASSYTQHYYDKYVSAETQK